MMPIHFVTGRPGTHRSFARVLAASLLAGLLAACGSAGLHQAPPNPTAEGAEGQIQLTWTAVPGAKSYTIRWEDQTAGETGFPNSIPDITNTNYLHTGLTDFHTYQYQIFAKGKGGLGPGSVLVSAEPGPIPATVQWTSVVSGSTSQTVYFDMAAGADGYRVYSSTTPSALVGRRPAASYVTVTSSPYVINNLAVGASAYYRVIGASGLRIGYDGPIVPTATFTVNTYNLPLVAPALGDLDGDGCLDLVSGKGDCLGSFATVDLAAKGLDGIFASGRAAGDDRLMDVNGDGKPDIFADVDAPATDTASRAILYLNQGSGTFQPDASVAALGIGGFGGTVLAADFNNDGYVDIFAPHDSNAGDGGHNWLLINDGSGNFTDKAAAAGLATNPSGAAYVPAGGQAVDFNEDGWVDILFGSRLMINNGDGTFSDGSAAAGLTPMADQGMVLADVDADGDLDLVRRDHNVTYVSYNNGGVFGPPVAIDGDATTQGAGLTACDINGDGFMDVAVASNDVSTGTGTPHLLLSVDGQLMPTFIPTELTAGTGDLLAANGLLTCGDLDKSGLPDLVSHWYQFRVLKSALPLASTITLRVLGANREYNQQGRIVRVVPAGAGGLAMARVIESGSGLRSQRSYDLQVGAPWPGDYQISVRFKDGWFTTTAQQGAKLTIYEDGRVVDGLQ